MGMGSIASHTLCTHIPTHMYMCVHMYSTCMLVHMYVHVHIHVHVCTVRVCLDRLIYIVNGLSLSLSLSLSLLEMK